MIHELLEIDRWALSKLEGLVSDLLDKLGGPCQAALKDAGYDARDIDEVILVGGMTRMPAVQERVKKIFAKEPNKGVNPDEVVAMGAAIQGGVSARLQAVLNGAQKEAERLKDAFVSTEHVLIATAKDEGEAGKALQKAGATGPSVSGAGASPYTPLTFDLSALPSQAGSPAQIKMNIK